MKTILVATDFSQSANNAARYAAELCALLKVKHLILFHAYQMPSIPAEVPVNCALSLEQVRKNREESLQELKQDLLTTAGSDTLILTKAECTWLEEGVDDLADICEAGLIVIGSSSKGIGERLLEGSGTRKLLKNCHFPILVVPSEARFSPIRKIVLGCDLRHVADTIPITKLIQLVKSFKAQLLVVNVSDSKEENTEKTHEEDTFYDFFEELNPSIQYIDGSNVSKGILAYADQYSADMVMVVAQQHSFLERMTKASVSSNLASKSNIPLLIIRK